MGYSIQNTKEEGLVNFLIYRDSRAKHYTAVCLTFDIVEHGKDPVKLRESIEEAALLHIEAVVEGNLDSKLLNRSAPKKYWKKLYDSMVNYEQSLKESNEKPIGDKSIVSDIWNRNKKELAVA